MTVDYQLGKIYGVVNTENDITYVGCTAKKLLASRMAGHRYEARQGVRNSPWLTAMRTIGVEKFRIVLITAFPCNSKDELEAEENRTIDAMIAAGKQLYNDRTQGKLSAEHKAKISAANIGRQKSAEARQKMSAAKLGIKHTEERNQKKRETQFQFGSIYLDRRGRWVFETRGYDGKNRQIKCFAVSKYGNYGAHFRAEEARRAVYPEWGNEEDIACDDLGHIEWD